MMAPQKNRKIGAGTDTSWVLDRLADMDQAAAIQMVTRIVGAADGLRLASTSNRLFEALLLREIKDRKAYKALGLTWEDFCDQYLRRSRRTIDEDIQSLNDLGEEFMRLADQLSLGRRALRALRQLPEGARPQVLDTGEIEVGDKRIPLDPEHRDEIRELIESLVEDMQSQFEIGRKQLEEREEEVTALLGRTKELEQRTKELEKEAEALKQELQAKKETDNPAAISDFERICVSIQILLSRLVRMIREGQAPSPEIAHRWCQNWHVHEQQILQYATGWKPYSTKDLAADLGVEVGVIEEVEEDMWQMESEDAEEGGE